MECILKFLLALEYIYLLHIFLANYYTNDIQVYAHWWHKSKNN